MRISDWSSDVCSSDLFSVRVPLRVTADFGGKPDEALALSAEFCVSPVLYQLCDGGSGWDCRRTWRSMHALPRGGGNLFGRILPGIALIVFSWPQWLRTTERSVLVVMSHPPFAGITV